MNLPLFLAFRLSASSQGRKTTPAVKVAVAAVALSVGVMLAAIAIVLGFKEEITRKVLGFNPHIVLKTSYAEDDGYSPILKLDPVLTSLLDSLPFIQSYSLGATSPAIFKTDNDFKGVYIKATDEGEMKRFLSSQFVAGRFPDLKSDTANIIISEIAARQLRLKAGDKLPVYFITDEVRIRPMNVAAIFNSHFDAYDDIYAFTSLGAIQEIGNLKSNEGTYLSIYVDDFNRIDEYAYELRYLLDNMFFQGRTDRMYEIETAKNSGANYFSWLQLLNMNVVVVLVLMTIVAAITLISGMMIIIVDKNRFISVMKSLGARNRMLRKTFVWLTLRVALTGLLIGNAIMIGLLYLQKYTHFIPLEAESYYIDFVPVEINWWYILILNAAILIVTYLLLTLPSRFVSTISPAKSLSAE